MIKLSKIGHVCRVVNHFTSSVNIYIYGVINCVLCRGHLVSKQTRDCFVFVQGLQAGEGFNDIHKVMSNEVCTFVLTFRMKRI